MGNFTYKFTELLSKLGCLGTLICMVITAIITTGITYAGIMLGAIPYMIVVALSFGITAAIFIGIKTSIQERKYYDSTDKVSSKAKETFIKPLDKEDAQEENAPDYTEEEFQKLPAWKRVEIMRERENQQQKAE